MDTHEQLEEWVHQRMVVTQPAAEWPDAAAAWNRFDGRLVRPRVPAFVWIGAAATLCAAILALPGPRLTAQVLWDRLVVGRVQVLIVDGPAAGFFTPEIYERPDTQPVPSFADAVRVAGFAPRLPASGLLSENPSFSVADITAARLQLSVPAIRHLVAEAGGSAGDVPDSWNRATLELRIGPVILADYDGVLLLQSLPFELITPAEFDLQLFYRTAFQALGMGESDAWALSRDLTISPALLMFMPKEDRDLVRDFSTRSGRGIMIEDVYGPGKIVAIWSGSDRIYAIYPDTRDISRDAIVTVANALD